jgi:serine/threonine protein kinase
VIHAGRDVPTGDVVAIKLEHRSIAPSLLRQEIEIYEELIGQPGIPRVFWHGYHCDFQAMVFELLGPNLEDLFRYCDNKFSLKTTLMLMDQLLHRVESLHAAGYLHRDIKPENFLLGTGKQGNIVYMTDFGLSTYQRDSHGQVMSHKPAASPRISLVGTCRYASVNGHLNVGKCRDCILWLIQRLKLGPMQLLHGVTTLSRWGIWPCIFFMGLFLGRG